MFLITSKVVDLPRASINKRAGCELNGRNEFESTLSRDERDPFRRGVCIRTVFHRISGSVNAD